ncbi:unnamed protein product [Gulo gulo]|uniref:Large ribosomal subunit protein uL22 n=1 Tax=Gulo gulo TaxID=48420 RepID=A0A9X9LTJ1_GULGU|nr:unnamed protein product [Gulo gulo]
MVELEGVPGTNSGSGYRVGGPGRVLTFYCTCLKMQSCAGPKGLDVDSLVMEHIQVNKAPEMQCRIYQAPGLIYPDRSSLCHREMILTEKEQTIPKPEEEVAQKKKMFQKKLKKQKCMAQE